MKCFVELSVRGSPFSHPMEGGLMATLSLRQKKKRTNRVTDAPWVVCPDALFEKHTDGYAVIRFHNNDIILFAIIFMILHCGV